MGEDGVHGNGWVPMHRGERERVSDADRRGVGDRFYILLNFRKP